MKRKIITIDTDKCNGCGLCIPDCPEGALQIIDGKARLVSDLFCDGLGACIKTCPTDALKIEEREAEQYNEQHVMEIIIPQGENTIKAHLVHLKTHGEHNLLEQAMNILKAKNLPIPTLNHTNTHACPGSMMRDRRNPKQESSRQNAVSVQSELRQWPVQLKLVNPSAPYFSSEELLVTADCVPFAYANFHDRFLKDKPIVVFCPKLDSDLDRYIEKLASIIIQNTVKRVSVVRMEVPCCGGTTSIVEEAIRKSGKNIIIKEYIISIDGMLK
jgi:NAD-dependent dihydropyrimidine dehydrogenase PreA subunit